MNYFSNRDQKLVRFVGHGDSETRTNVKLVISLSFQFKKPVLLLKKTDEKSKVNHQRKLNNRNHGNKSNHIVAVIFFLLIT